MKYLISLYNYRVYYLALFVFSKNKLNSCKLSSYNKFVTVTIILYFTSNYFCITINKIEYIVICFYTYRFIKLFVM